MIVSTWNLNVDTDTPVRGSLRIVDIQIPQAHLLYRRNDLTCLLVTRDSNLFSVSCRVE
jgi:hypothetical protein